MMLRNYRQCSVGVLDTRDDPDMRFDEEGRCHYYHAYKAAEAANVFTGEEGQARLQSLANCIRNHGVRKTYDCVIGLSGGVDSTYVALQARRLGLRPLAVLSSSSTYNVCHGAAGLASGAHRWRTKSIDRNRRRVDGGHSVRRES